MQNAQRPILKLSVATRHIALKYPLRVAFGTISGVDTIEVRAARDGVVGRGECCPMSIYHQTA